LALFLDFGSKRGPVGEGIFMTLQLDRGKVWTYQDYLELPEDGRRYEIIDGVLYVSPSPRQVHQLLSRRLQFFFYQFELEGRGFVYNAPMDLLMPGCTPVQPDLIFLTREQRPLILDKYIEGVPELLVEILSPSTRSLDRVKKLNRYAKNGVQFYLIVDPEASTLEVFVHQAGRFVLDASLGQEDSWTYQDKTLDLAALFASLPD